MDRFCDKHISECSEDRTAAFLGKRESPVSFDIPEKYKNPVTEETMQGLLRQAVSARSVTQPGEPCRDGDEIISEGIRFVKGDCLCEFLKKYRMLVEHGQSPKARRYRTQHVKGLYNALFSGSGRDGIEAAAVKVKISRHTVPGTAQTGMDATDGERLSIQVDGCGGAGIEELMDALYTRAQPNALRIEFSLGDRAYEMLWEDEWLSLTFSSTTVIHAAAIDYYVRELTEGLVRDAANKAIYKMGKEERKKGIILPRTHVADLYQHYIRHRLLPRGQEWLGEVYQDGAAAAKFGELLAGLLEAFPG